MTWRSAKELTLEAVRQFPGDYDLCGRLVFQSSQQIEGIASAVI